MKTNSGDVRGSGTVSALTLPEALRARLVDEARRAFPRECCGLVDGVRLGDAIQAIDLHPTKNLAAESDRFEIDPAAHFALLRALRGSEREIVGCYHSHPNGKAELSDRDRECGDIAEFVWLVVAVRMDGACELSASYCRGGSYHALAIADASQQR